MQRAFSATATGLRTVFAARRFSVCSTPRAPTTAPTKAAPSSIIALTSRAVVQLEGATVLPFLQGLLTADVTRFSNKINSDDDFVDDDDDDTGGGGGDNVSGKLMFVTDDANVNNNNNQTSGGNNGSGAEFTAATTPPAVTTPRKRPDTLYAHALNASGRVLVDLFVFRNRDKDDECVWLDCDAAVLNSVVGHLKRHLLREKIQISVSDLRVHCVVNGETTAKIGGRDPRLSGPLSESVVRLDRVLLPPNVPASSVCSAPMSHESEYVKLRVENGLAEGKIDFPPADSLPLEGNLDILRGVSWTKGCYIGQELTARTHHRGVVRKRIMPVVSTDGTSLKGLEGSDIFAEKAVTDGARSIGKLRTCTDQSALALVRIGQGEVFVRTPDGRVISITRKVPAWWPRQLKETATKANSASADE